MFMRITAIALLAFSTAAVAGCGHSDKGAASPGTPSCRDDVGDDVEVAGRTGASGVKTGAKTAVEGVKTAGSATAGLVEGGTDEAKARWKEGAAQTKKTAREGRSETKATGDVPKCR